MNTKILSIAAVAGLLIGSTAMVQAQQPSAPGQRMQGGAASSPGASGASPGHEMQERGSKGGPGASGFAPGHQGTTGAGDRDDKIGGRDRDDKMRGDRDDKMRGDRDDRTTGFGGRDSDDRPRGDRDDRMMDQDKRGIDKD
jgi:hypothetical protein